MCVGSYGGSLWCLFITHLESQVCMSRALKSITAHFVLLLCHEFSLLIFLKKATLSSTLQEKKQIKIFQINIFP